MTRRGVRTQSSALLVADSTAVVMAYGAANRSERPITENAMTTSESLSVVSAGARRMRWYRERRRRGITCMKVQLRRSEVEALIAYGLLQPAQRQDRNALAAALHRYLDANPIAGRRQ